jgi:hypothetical protein
MKSFICPLVFRARVYMQVLDLAVAEESARRGISPMLDIEGAGEIRAQHERTARDSAPRSTR